MKKSYAILTAISLLSLNFSIESATKTPKQKTLKLVSRTTTTTKSTKVNSKLYNEHPNQLVTAGPEEINRPDLSKLDLVIQPQMALQLKDIAQSIKALNQKYSPDTIIHAIEHATRALTQSRNLINFYSTAIQISSTTKTSLNTTTLRDHIVIDTLENLILIATATEKHLIGCVKAAKEFSKKNTFSKLLRVGKTKRTTLKVLADLQYAYKLTILVRGGIDAQVALVQKIAEQLTKRGMYEKKSLECANAIDKMMLASEEITELHHELID
jgi:hypothetical protein